MDQRYTVAGMLRHFAADRGDADMLVDGGRRFSWAAHHARAAAVGHALAADGVGVDDRVAFVDRNGAHYFEVLFGGAMAGAVGVAVNWRLAPDEMAAVVDDSVAPVLVVHPDHAPALAQMGSPLPHVRRIVVLGDVPEGLPQALGRRAVSYDDWTADRPTGDPGHVGAPDEVALQLYTSGTTGLPKGVMLSNTNLHTVMAAAGETFGIGPDTVSLVAMPLFHIGGSGWALCAMSRGGTSVLLRDFLPTELLRLVAEERITDAFVVPAVLMFLLGTTETRTADLSSLRTIFYGASPIAEDVLRGCLQVFGCRFAQVYGMTETTGAITALLPEDHDPDGPRAHLLRSAGRPFDHVALRIVDPETGTDVPTGDVGELWTRSAQNMLGYWAKPHETAAVVGDDGWLRTGDAGYVDEEGYVFLHDRVKDMIVTGGENVYPAEVENALLAHPDVADGAVIGVPHDTWGETVLAVVVAVPGSVPDPDAIIAFCRDRLAHYKCPTSVTFFDALPRNPSGKILKRELREPYWQGHERRVR